MVARISSGSDYESRYAYSRAVVAGDFVFVSGTTGFDYATMTIADDAHAQCQQALSSIAAALAEAGAKLDDVVRVRYLVASRDDFEACQPVIAAAFAVARPAATMMIAELLDARMKIEIEAVAYRP